MSQSRKLADVFEDLAPGPSIEPDFSQITRAGISKRRHRMFAIGTLVTLIAAMAVTIVPRTLTQDSPIRGVGVADAPDQTDGGQRHYENPAKGLSLDYPSHWHLNDQGTSDLSSPDEIVVLSTVPPIEGGTCAPEAAIERLESTDALLLLLEYPEEVGNFDKRPETFSSKNLSEPAMLECYPRPVRSVSFQDRGRFFQAFIIWGDQTSETERNETLQILDSLEVTPIT